MIPWNYFSSFHFNVRWPGRGEEQEIYHFQRFQIFRWSQFALLWKIEQFGPIFLVNSWTIHLFFKQLCLTVFVLIWVFSFLSLFWTISLLVTKNLGMNNPFFETLSLFSFFISVDNNPTYYKKLMLKDKCDLSISKHIRYVIKLWCAGCSIMSTCVSLIFSNIMHAGFIPFLLCLSWYFFTMYKFRVFEPFINTLRHLLNSLY